jgi:hypothetical protein
MRFVCACFCIATISHWHPLLEPLPKRKGFNTKVRVKSINLLRDKASTVKFEQLSHHLCPFTANLAGSRHCFSQSLA